MHWADPTTLEALGILIERLGDVPLLAVLTHRPEFEPPWTKYSYVTALDLARLAPTQSRELISNLTVGKALPDDLVEEIIAKTDGIPLFMEELTKTIIESGDLIDQGDRYVYARPFLSVAIPETLRDSLMARLDRVAAVKKDRCSRPLVIGREFGYELLAEIEMMSEAALVDVLARLVASELASCRGEIPESVYTFKHALVQDTAYDSLLKSQRMTIHGTDRAGARKALARERDWKPELLAHHYTAAGLFEAATPYWRRAGELAMQRFALREAITHLNNGLMLIEKMPPGPRRSPWSWSCARSWALPWSLSTVGGRAEVNRILEPIAWSLTRSTESPSGLYPGPPRTVGSLSVRGSACRVASDGREAARRPQGRRAR